MIFQQMLQVLTKPKDFFTNLPKQGGFKNPLLFILTMMAIAGAIQCVLFLIFPVVGPGVSPAAGRMAGVASLFLFPIMGIIGSFIGAAILFVILLILKANPTYEHAYRITAYLAALSPISAIVSRIPYVPIVVGLFGLFLLVTAVIASANVRAKIAWAVFGTLWVLLYGGSYLMQRSAQMAMNRMQDMGPALTKEQEEALQKLQETSKQWNNLAEQMKKQQQAGKNPDFSQQKK